MKVKKCLQFSVFLENKVGALSALCKLISNRSINLYGISAIDTIEEAVLRIVAQDESATLAALQEAGFRPMSAEVLLVELDNEPGATGKMATRLADAGINIDYVYASAHPDCNKAFIVVRTHQLDLAEKVLRGGD